MLYGVIKPNLLPGLLQNPLHPCIVRVVLVSLLTLETLLLPHAQKAIQLQFLLKLQCVCPQFWCRLQGGAAQDRSSMMLTGVLAELSFETLSE